MLCIYNKAVNIFPNELVSTGFLYIVMAVKNKKK